MDLHSEPTDKTTPNTDQTPAAQGTPAWVSQLSGDLQSNETLTSFGSLSELGKAYLELSEKQGKAVELPEDDSSDGWDELYKRLGRPDGADGYDLAVPEEVGKDFATDETRLAAYKDVFHKLGLTQKQAQGLFETSIKEEAAAVAQVKAAREAEMNKAAEKLKGDWGNEYDSNLAVARKAAVAFGGEELGQLIEETGIGNNPAFVKAFYAIGKKIGDGEFVAGSSGGNVDNREFGEILR